MANLPIPGYDPGGNLLPTDLLLIARPTDVEPNKNYKIAGSAIFSQNPRSIWFDQDLPNSNSLMAIGGFYANRTLLSPSNPTYSLPNGDSSVIPNGSIIAYTNVGSNIPIITATGPDAIIIDRAFYTQIQPGFSTPGDALYSISFRRVGSTAWRLILDMPFTGSLNAS
jgi:hypothetical protein